METNWTWKHILHAITQAKGQRVRALSCLEAAWEQVKTLDPEEITEPRLRRLFQREVQKNLGTSLYIQFNKLGDTTRGDPCLKYLMLREVLTHLSGAEWEGFLAYGEEQGLPLPPPAQEREAYVTGILGQVLPVCAAMGLRPAGVFRLPPGGELSPRIFDGTAGLNDDYSFYLLDFAHLPEGALKGNVPRTSTADRRDFSRVYVDDAPSGEHNTIDLAYKNLLGSPHPGAEEFSSGNLLCTFQNSLQGETYRADRVADLRYSLPMPPVFQEGDRFLLTCYPWFVQRSEAAEDGFDWAKVYGEELSQAARLGYTQHPPKLFLEGIRLPHDGDVLTLRFSENGYLEQRVLRKHLSGLLSGQDCGGADHPMRRDWETVLAGDYLSYSALPPERKLWANVGGGCWVVTSDGYLVLSYRSNRVGEVPGILSYSASGSFDYRTPEGIPQRPEEAMAKELREELGIADQGVAETLRLIALGIDTERFLIQFSYLWNCPYTLAELNSRRVREATRQGKSEQLTLFAPLRRELHRDYLGLLKRFQFEPGAAFSLDLLLQKRFGWPFTIQGGNDPCHP